MNVWPPEDGGSIRRYISLFHISNAHDATIR